MEKITDLEQLNKLLAPCMKRGVLTNNYLMYKDYKQYIEQGVLYYKGQLECFFSGMTGITGGCFIIYPVSRMISPCRRTSPPS